MDNFQFVEANSTLDQVMKKSNTSAQLIDGLWHRYRLCTTQDQRDAVAMAVIGLLAVSRFSRPSAFKQVGVNDGNL